MSRFPSRGAHGGRVGAEQPAANVGLPRARGAASAWGLAARGAPAATHGETHYGVLQETAVMAWGGQLCELRVNNHDL